MMDVRQKLIDLMLQVKVRLREDKVLLECIAEDYADHLVANGVTIEKHGKWLINPDGYYPYCSECGQEPKEREMTKFCSNCGTNMDLK